MRLWESLSPANKAKLIQVYWEITGEVFDPPSPKEKPIECPVILEEDIPRLMEEIPPYTITELGRG